MNFMSSSDQQQRLILFCIVCAFVTFFNKYCVIVNVYLQCWLFHSHGYVATATHFGMLTIWETGSLSMRHQCKHDVSILYCCLLDTLALVSRYGYSHLLWFFVGFLCLVMLR